jgi:hypothetical protein
MRKLHQEFGQKAPVIAITAPRPFCQETQGLSGGILNWPRPGIARRNGKGSVHSPERRAS